MKSNYQVKEGIRTSKSVDKAHSAVPDLGISIWGQIFSVNYFFPPGYQAIKNRLTINWDLQKMSLPKGMWQNRLINILKCHCVRRRIFQLGGEKLGIYPK